MSPPDSIDLYNYILITITTNDWLHSSTNVRYQRLKVCYCYVWKNYISRARLASTKKFTRVLPSVAGQASFPTQNKMNNYPNHQPTEQLWPGTESMTYELLKLWKPISDRHPVIIRINSPMQDAIKTWEVIRDWHPIKMYFLTRVCFNSDLGLNWKLKHNRNAR
jgi:hypothetical protein